MPGDAYLELTCSACGQREVVGPLQMLERLRAPACSNVTKSLTGNWCASYFDPGLPLTHAGVADRQPWC